MATPRHKWFLVVAIDFGTTYSGYAFSFKHEFMKDPGKISCNQWMAGSNQLISLKTPTVLLLKWHKDSREFTAEGFGYEAEDKYTSLVEDDEHEDYFLARRFKMDLYKQTVATGLSRDLKLKLAKGRNINMMRAFSMCIASLKDHFLAALEKRMFSTYANCLQKVPPATFYEGQELFYIQCVSLHLNTVLCKLLCFLAAKVEMADIRWVLTVPAIWTDGAKQFMRESAVMAGIDTENLAISLEPEAASLYCLRLPALNSNSTNDDTERRFPVGTKYMVVDCGGGTIDVCVHEVVGDRSIVEKHVASGGNWGGTVVDENFLQIWIEIVGRDVFKRFTEKHREDVTEMYREFEFKKRCIKPGQEKMTIRIPIALVKLCQEMKGFDFENALSVSKYSDRIKTQRDKVKMDIDIVRSCFDDPVRKTVEHINLVLEDKACTGVEKIILVGGFAESCFLQEALKNNLPTKEIIIPEDPGMAVVKGAVVFGHDPLTIQARFARYTYGMRATSIVKMALPKQTNKRGKRRSRRNTAANSQTVLVEEDDCFSIHVKKGDYLPIGIAQKTLTYFPHFPDQIMILLDFFMSTDETPKLVTDESCSRIGSILVFIPDTTDGLDRPVSVTMTFSGTEIQVRAVEERTRRVTKANLNLLQ